MQVTTDKKAINPNTVFDTTRQVKNLGNDDVTYERVGSLVFWEFPLKRAIRHDYDEIKSIFADTDLNQFIQPVNFSERITRLAESIVQQHGNLYGTPLNYLQQKDKSNPGYFYLSFYTGDIKHKSSTSFQEHAKMWFGEDGAYIALLDKDNQFLIQEFPELNAEWHETKLIRNKDILKALGNYANTYGYRFNSHGGHYFVPHQYTDSLYAIKRVIKGFRQIFSITPLIAGTEEDIEEILRILGDGFKQELETAERELFEICIAAYNFHQDWDQYEIAVNNRDVAAIQSNRIPKTKYGRKLTAQILAVAANSGQDEYRFIVKELMGNIKPNKNKSADKLYRIQSRLTEAIKKLDIACKSPLIDKWLDRMYSDVYSVNEALKKVSNLIIDEVLSIM